MRKYFIYLIFMAIGVQSLLSFVTGHTLAVTLAGKKWQLIHLVLISGFYFWLINYALKKTRSEQRSSRSLIRLKVLYLLCGLILLGGVLRGASRGYFAFLRDSETIFWVIALIPVGWSVRMKNRDWEKALGFLVVPSILLAAVGIPYVLATRALGLSVPGYLYYDELFLIAFGFLYYFGRIMFLQGKGWKNYAALLLLAVYILVDLNKAIILPLLVSVMLLVWIFNARSKKNEGKKVSSRWVKVLWTIMNGFVVVALLGQLTSTTSIADYYRNRITGRILHSDTGDISGGRFVIWENAWRVLQREPWLGYGIGLRTNVNDGEIVGDIRSQWISMHNQYLYFILALGIPGAGIILLSIIYFWGYTVKSFLRYSGGYGHIVFPFLAFVWVMLLFGLPELWNISPTGYILLGLGMGIVPRFFLQEPAFRLAKVA